jgi:hypothetical protein
MIVQFGPSQETDSCGISPMQIPDAHQDKVLAVLAALHASVTVTRRNGELHCQVTQEESE